MPQHTTNSENFTTRKIPSKVCSSKSKSRAIKSSHGRDEKAQNISDEDTSSDSENSIGSACSGSCGKIGGCGKKEKIESLEF
ncbi:hypothetical protein EYC84_011776 [Monilinia fructicola]|uniref:Uncharacterized protein n=1 Tax=Monilinia fructicola TaxID=38448 RepID=A0A5M9J3W4_MONFR|nr:hypothetical protein EYC84_011776 [Monilinia fructicola]